ncbi:MAG TPA: epoxyqueuosine reductase, partial [Candidatus Aerophobetes bacterium]|nr:epoxyqueuosine reductase [Candidatus Aerophobetes bacterium]
MKKFTEKVVKKAKELGADLVGIAPVERWANAPIKLSPQGLLPGSKSVIVVAIHHPDACVELGGHPSLHDLGPYEIQAIMNEKLDFISFRLARFLEDCGYKSLPTVSSRIIRFRPFEGRPEGFTPEISHIHAGACAGLGEIGFSGLLITPEYGPRVRLVSVITEAELEPTPLYRGVPLCDKCMECVKHCPTEAFRKEVREIAVIKIEDRVFKYPKKNMWRCCWAEGFALSLELPIPDKVDEKVILEFLNKYGPYKGEIGGCLKYCLPPKLRDEKRPFQRKKEKVRISKNKLVEKIVSMAKGNYVDYLEVLSPEEVKKWGI